MFDPDRDIPEIQRRVGTLVRKHADSGDAKTRQAIAKINADVQELGQWYESWRIITPRPSIPAMIAIRAEKHLQYFPK